MAGSKHKAVGTPETCLKGTISAFAKLNLSLKVVGRRDDGYHLLDMINVPVDLHDQISLKLIEANLPSSVRILIDGRAPLETALLDAALRAELEDPARNLAGRAVALVTAELGVAHSFELEIVKRIPLGAGMGGGSSDAAAALNLTLSLLSRRLDRTRLLQIATSLGADVPFFLQSGAARVGGIGDQVESIALPELDCLAAAIFIPPFGISTAKVFSLLRAEPVEAITHGESSKCSELRNDLERFATTLEPRVGLLLSDLRSACKAFPLPYAGMTGSGSVCFALFPRALHGRIAGVLSAVADKHSCELKFCALRLQRD